MLKRLWREPLVHFLILGAVVFLLFRFTATPGAAPDGRIVISSGSIEQLATAFERTWQRPPTAGELDGLIEDRIKDEVLYRAALAMGLDKDDTVIRRRMRQKYEFLTEDAAVTTAPSDRDLQGWLDKHPDKFRVEPKMALSQIYFDVTRRGAQASKDARTLLARLDAAGSKADTSELGDATMLPGELALSSVGEIARVFGDSFAQTVARMEPGRWSGPVQSSYGWHLVYVSARTQGRLRPLAEVRDEVQREWLTARRRSEADARYRALREKYEIVVERPRVQQGASAPESGSAAKVARGQ
ncbi:MAG: peptidyl-prolyl cis-trans isomerase [Burkholderiales bacterium]|nr:peptidyl-prolyl cis-trans isomerase [Burkholderiales bacterium]